MKLFRSPLLIIILICTIVSVHSQRTGLYQIEYNRRETDSLEKLLNNTTDLREKVLIYKTLCWKLRNTNLEAKALEYADKGIELARKINFKKGEAEITRYKGMITWNFLHQNITIDLYKTSLSISKEIGDKEGEAYSYDRLGMTEFYNKRISQALGYFNKAYTIFSAINNIEGLAYANSHLNWLFTYKKQYNNALETGKKALQLRLLLKSKEGISNSLADIGLTFKEINMDSALVYVSKAVEIEKENDLELLLSEHTLLLSSIYEQKNDLNNAFLYANESYLLARKNHSQKQIENTTEAISKIYEQQHNYSKALEFLHFHDRVKDSLFNEDINKRIVEQEMEYKYDKEKQIANERENVTKIILTAIIILLIIVAVVFFFKYRFTELLKVEKLRRKISADLHDDIGATLSSINIYAELAKSEPDNFEYINIIQQHTQHTIGNLDDLVWSINPNNDNLKTLVDRMQSFALPLLKDNKVAAEFEAILLDEEILISLEKRRSIYFAFKEMVANVLKHSQSSFCSIKIEQKRMSLIIEIKDNGKGFEIEMINNQRNGLRNLKLRANENNGNFNVVSNLGKGTECTFSIVLK